MKFNHDKFFEGYRQQFGGLTQQQVNGLNVLLRQIEADPFVTRIEWASYMLGTMKHETANTFLPIHEYGGHAYFVQRYGSQTKVGKNLGNLTPEDGATFAGEGDVQLTGRANSDKATAALRKAYPEVVAEFERRTGTTFDLVKNPAERGDPAIAYAIMSYGMRTGMFTGKKLPATGKSYTSWRGIINGTDQASLIAGYATKFETILRAAYVDDSVIPFSAAASNGNSANTSEQKPADEPAAPPPTSDAPTPPEAPPSVPNEPTSITETQYQGIGLMGVLKKDFAAVGGGNISFQALQGYATESSGWSPWVIAIITKLATIAIVAGVVWLIFRLAHYGIWKVTEWKKQRLQAVINTNPNLKDLKFVAATDPTAVTN